MSLEIGKSRLAQRLTPCLPSPAKAPPSGPGSIHEIKHDGFRIIARRDARGVRLVTRNGNDFSARFPNVAAAVNALPVRSCLIDGEAIVTDDRGLAVFEMIRNRRHEAATVLCAFDLIELDGEDLRRAPLELRKARLRKTPTTGSSRYRVQYALHSRRRDRLQKRLRALGIRHRVKDAHLAGDLGDIDNFANLRMKAMQGAFGASVSNARVGISCAAK